MTFAMGLTFAILIAALIMFILDVYPIDFVAFSVMALVLVLGPILDVTPQEAISGFSNPATITVLAMFILSAGIYQTGVVNRLAHHMLRLSGQSHIKQLLVVMFAVGPISAFINNAAAVAILIPSVITLARKRHRAPSKLLIPLSYFSQLAGAVTLVGTSSNILASALSAKAGLGGFSMFEFSHIGLLVFTTGAIYLLFIAPRLLPEHRGDEPVIDSYQIKSYLSEVIVLEDSPLIGKSVVENRLGQLFDIDVLEIIRTGQRLHPPLDDEVFKAGDILFVKANAKQLLRIKDMEGLAIEPEMRLSNREITDKDRGLLEVEIGPNSALIGGTLESNNFRNYFNCTVIAIQKRGELVRERLSRVSLNFGDMLLVQG
ncbi:MAG: SLC13 family permease, partial [Anaerolineae bacterium]|nr:SLC13 family permease [Anaerolineae bacterium]